MKRTSALRFGAFALVAAATLLGLACDPVRKNEQEPSTEPTSATQSDPRLPGVESVDEALQQRLDRELASKGPGYVPRTHHL
ncbi:MAG: hypothetical protein EP303_01960, partial [Deltaproteobacteria bacterium]